MKTQEAKRLVVRVEMDDSFYTPVPVKEFLEQKGYWLEHSDLRTYTDSHGTHLYYKWCNIRGLSTLDELGELVNLFYGHAGLKDYYSDDYELSIMLEIDEEWMKVEGVEW